MALTFRTRKLVKPEDLNGRNTLFGGRLLAWIDEECYIYCACQMRSHDIVTKYISEMNFESPAYQGDVIEIGVDTIEVGRTSLTVRAVVRDKDTKREIISIDKIVFVSVNREGSAIPHGQSKPERSDTDEVRESSQKVLVY